MTSTTLGLPSQPATMDTMHMRLPSSNLSMQASNLNASIHMTRRQQKFKLEPMKILEPSSKKLSLPESQRIVYILEELIRQIEMIDYIELITNNDEKMRQLIRSSLTEEERKKNFGSLCARLNLFTFFSNFTKLFSKNKIIQNYFLFQKSLILNRQT